MITLPNLSLESMDRLLRDWQDERDRLLTLGQTEAARELTLAIAYLDDVRIEKTRRIRGAA